MTLKYSDVFVPGGFPRHTYNPRMELNLENRLREANENLCKLVAVTGHTKSGKTVLVRKVFPQEDAIWIDGGTVAAEDDFWGVILEQMDLFQGVSDQNSKSSDASIGGKGSAEANLLVAKGSGEVSAGLRAGRSSTKTQSRTISPRVAALRGLRKASIPVVVDDFHYLPTSLQGSVIRALKPLIFDGLAVVIIAIPHRRYDAVKVEREMTGRILPVDIPPWSTAELKYIPQTGFALLNHQATSATWEALAAQSIGSPHLMQDFCRTICRREEIVAAPWPNTPLAVDLSDMEAAFREVAETIGRPIFEKLARGPRQRSDRVPRALKDGKSVDIYELVLHALAHLRPDLVSLEYEQLRAAIRDVSAASIPQLHEVARVLKHMASIAATDQSSTPVIDFEDSEKKLHITDPFFAFFLRWGKLDG